jgi:hypothetical protein
VEKEFFNRIVVSRGSNRRLATLGQGSLIFGPIVRAMMSMPVPGV